MKDRPAPRSIRIFLSSPGDLADERGIALNVIRNLPHESPYRERIHLIPVAWDDPGSRTPMLATLTPQAAINRRLPKPSECDIVVVILWSRMGTPLPFPDYCKPDGEPYFSGTEWEYLDAERAAREHSHGLPLIVVYRRTEKVMIPIDDPDFDTKREQYERVKKFFERFSDPSGSITGGINPYATPEDFRQAFQNDLRELVDTLLNLPRSSIRNEVPRGRPAEEIWPRDKSPFSGLRALTPADAPVFFGRGRETDALIEKVRNNRFVAVVGASGSGKSSLVGAGLIPRLKRNAISGENVGSKDWHVVMFTPASVRSDPFLSLTDALVQTFPSMIPSPLEAKRLKAEFVAALQDDPTSLIDTCAAVLADQPPWSEVLLFVDQFEELFTVVSEQYRAPFVDLLAAAAASWRVRAVVTMRADFYYACLIYKALEELLRTGSFPLGAPNQVALYEMITRPASLAGLAFEEGLPERILDDTGSEPGALALMAYTLDELHQACTKDGSRVLSHAAYDALGGVTRAIGTRAENAFANLTGNDEMKERTLHRVFHVLVDVDEHGRITRRRAPKGQLLTIDGADVLIDCFAGPRVRLLVTTGDDERAEVEVAHEALFQSWPRIARWIEATQDDFRILKKARAAARDWESSGRKQEYLWTGERLESARAMINRLSPQLSKSEQDFLRSESEHLLDELELAEISHDRRVQIGDRLSIIGDPRNGISASNGLPVIDWCVVPRGEIEFKGRTYEIHPFHLSRYPVTYIQFDAFVEAADGYMNSRWWNGLIQKGNQPPNQHRAISNHPADMINWYDAMAFCRWLSHRLKEIEQPISANNDWVIRLPTEWEWQQAATGGHKDFEYPWGPRWDASRANTGESGLSRTSAVGMYPHGSSPTGCLDMAGNVWEWCFNPTDDLPKGLATDDSKCVLKGGSRYNGHAKAKVRARFVQKPHVRDRLYGFRIALAPIIK